MVIHDFDIRPMQREELDLAVEWAAAEGWNPGLHDADIFYATWRAMPLPAMASSARAGKVSKISSTPARVLWIISAVMKCRYGMLLVSLKSARSLLLGAACILLGSLAAAGAGTDMNAVRVFTTEPARFEYLFTGAMNDADDQPLLAFNQRNGRTWFVRQGESLGPFRVTGYEAKTNRVYNPSLNATLDEPAGKVTLAGPGGATLILEQGRPLPWPGRVAWLVRLDCGLWWQIQEQDIFVMGDQLVFVEEIDEDGVTVTAESDVVFIRRMLSGDKDDLNRLWADRKRQEQKTRELALQRRREEAARATAVADRGASYFTYERGPQVEIRGPSRFFYGCEYRFPAAFQAYPGVQYVNGQPFPSYVVLPSRFETRYSGTLLTGP